MAGSDQFVAVVGPALIFGLIYLLIFLWNRNKYRDIYSPRRLLLGAHAVPPPLPDGWFSWIKALIDVPEATVVQRVGLDAAVYLRFVRMGFQFCLVCMIMFAFLIPVHVEGGNGAADMDMLSMSNIENKSDSLWAHLVATYFFSILFYYLARKNYIEMVQLAQDYKSHPRAQQYSIMVRSIPEKYRTEETLSAFFKQLFPDSLLSVYLVREWAELDKEIDKYLALLKSLEHAKVVLAQSKEQKRPTHKASESCGICACCVGEEVDSIDYFTGKAQESKQKIEDLRKQEAKPTSTAFVSFTTLTAAAQAAQSRLAPEAGAWLVSMAPEPRDLFWKNIYHEATPYHQSAMSAFTAALVLLWAIPISFISSLTSLESLSASLPFLDPIVDSNAAVKGFLQGFLPTLVLIVFMALLPAILRAITVVEGAASESALEKGVLSKYFFFQVFNVFLVTTISGTIFQSISEIIDDPTSIAKLLAIGLPKNALFFINIVILNGLSGIPSEIARAAPLIVSRIMLKWVAKTDREKAAAVYPGAITYSILIATHALNWVLIVSYLVIAPVMIPFGVIFFAVAYIIYKHQLCYVYIPIFESAGSMWPRVFGFMTSGVMIAQITLVGIVGLKYGYIQAPLMIPLIFITSSFKTSLQEKYASLMESPNLVLTAARKSDGSTPLSAEAQSLLKDAFVAPCMRLDLDRALDPPPAPYDRFTALFAAQHPDDKDPSELQIEVPVGVADEAAAHHNPASGSNTALLNRASEDHEDHAGAQNGDDHPVDPVEAKQEESLP